MKNPFDPGYYTSDELRSMGFRSVGSNVAIAKTCTIIGLGNIEIGDNVRIDGYTSIIAAGSGFASIGSYVHIAGYCGIYAAHGVRFGDFAGLSSGVRIYSASDDYSGGSLTNPTVPDQFKHVSSGLVELKRHVIVGAGAVLLPAVELGEGVAVGALSLVNKSLGPWAIYMGVPAKKIKERSRALLLKERELLRVEGGQ